MAALKQAIFVVLLLSVAFGYTIKDYDSWIEDYFQAINAF